jgi:hypothetical protein
LTPHSVVGIGTSSPTQKLSINGNLQFEANDGIAIGAKESLSVNLNSSGGQSGRVFQVKDNGTARLTVQQAGNVGIGEDAPISRLHLADSGSGGVFIAVTNDTSGHTSGNGVEFGMGAEEQAQIWNYENSYFRIGTNNSEGLRLDASGRLLVGTAAASNQNNAGGASAREAKAYIFNANATSTERFSLAINSGAANASGASINLNKTRASTDTHTVVQSGDTLGEIRFQGSDGTFYVQGARIEAAVDGTPGSQDMPGRLAFSTTADGASSPTERMRITNDGRTTCFSSGQGLTSVVSAAAGTTVQAIVAGHSATSIGTGTASFRVWSNGNVENTNDSYGALSDIKLKENIVDAESQWDDFKSVRFRKYNFKEETGHETFTQLGVIAQELELVSPGLVAETPDLDEDGNDLGTTTKSVKYSILTKKALVALQEAMERIETLEAKVAALETK